MEPEKGALWKLRLLLNARDLRGWQDGLCCRVHVYLIRHAHAEDGEDDAARPLSRKGEKQIRRIGRFLRECEAIELAEFWHSPLVRSKDTAELLADRLRLDAPLVEVAGLLGEDDPSVMARKLARVRKPVAVVGHEPHLSALASLMVAGKAQPPCFTLDKCAVVCLEQTNHRWSVRWQISPELV